MKILLQACLHNIDEALAACKRIGYPIMLKASWGGGGKGIRKVRLMPLTKQNFALPSMRMGQGLLCPACSGHALQPVNTVRWRGVPCALPFSTDVGVYGLEALP